MPNDQQRDPQADADELLAAMDSSGMSPRKAEQVLADPIAPQDKKDMADEILAEMDSTGMTPDKAQQIAGQKGQ